jgi:nitrate/TMAO reductase-like tetraheme cytochrome c subunit
MHTNGHTLHWGTHSGVGRARETKIWYQQLRDWWTAHTAARQQAKQEVLHRCWDTTREAVTSHRAEAAPEMAAAHRAISVVTMLYGLSQ